MTDQPTEPAEAPAPEPPRREFSTLRHIAAWGVHLYTGLGLPLAMLAAKGLHDGDARLCFTALAVAAIVDATDGMMARAVKVLEVVPSFSGRKLDDIIDFLTFAFIPGLGFAAFGLLPPGWEWLAIIPVMTSGYGFCQDLAKTDDAFVGFPSYWNIVLIYLWAFRMEPWTNAIIILGFAITVFIPIHYIYPTKTKLLRRLTLSTGAVWTLAILVMCLWPDAPWVNTVALISFVYPIYYYIISMVHHGQVHRRTAPS